MQRPNTHVGGGAGGSGHSWLGNRNESSQLVETMWLPLDLLTSKLPTPLPGVRTLWMQSQTIIRSTLKSVVTCLDASVKATDGSAPRLKCPKGVPSSQHIVVPHAAVKDEGEWVT